jgi:hypothetical protein
MFIEFSEDDTEEFDILSATQAAMNALLLDYHVV